MGEFLTKEDGEKPFTIEGLHRSLVEDGFTVSKAFLNDFRRFGIIAGIILVHDGSDGMRTVKNEESVVIGLFNDLRNTRHPKHRVALNYLGKVIVNSTTK